MAGRILTIGIGPQAAFEPQAGAEGEETPAACFETLADFARLMSGKNLQLLNIIREHKPGSMLELAEKSGRPLSGLTDTLKEMERAGIIRLVPAERRRVRPEVICDDIRIMLSLSSADSPPAGR